MAEAEYLVARQGKLANWRVKLTENGVAFAVVGSPTFKYRVSSTTVVTGTVTVDPDQVANIGEVTIACTTPLGTPVGRYIGWVELNNQVFPTSKDVTLKVEVLPAV